MAEEYNGRTEWEEYYKLPIQARFEYDYFTDSNDTLVLSFGKWALDRPYFIEWFIAKINGTEIEPECQKYNNLYSFIYDDVAICAVCEGDVWHIADIRGWGTLTGPGGFHLCETKAEDVQDAFAEHLIYKLNKQVTGMFTIKEVVKELNEGKVVYDTKDRVFIYKQVPTVVPREIVPKMTSLPNEMKGIVKMYSGTMDFAPVQYNKYNPENGQTETWCPGCAWFGNGRYILASDFLKKQ